MPLDDFFEIIKNIINRHGAKIIFRRFRGDGFSSGWRVMLNDNNLSRIYDSDGYSKIYFSLGAVPSHDTDWEFTDNAAKELLVLSGGKSQGNMLELSDLRVFSKSSTAKKIFNEMTKEIKTHTRKGELICNGVVCSHILHSENATNFRMQDGLGGNEYQLEQNM